MKENRSSCEMQSTKILKDIGNDGTIVATRGKSMNQFELISECRLLCSALSAEILREVKDNSFFGNYYSKWGIIWLRDHTFYDANAKVFFSVIVDGDFYHGYDVEYIVEPKENVLGMLAHDIYNMRRIYQSDEPPAIVAAAFTIADGLEVNSDIKEYKPPIDVLKYVAYN